MKKIPYGVSDLRKLRDEDYLYVDKTRFIERMENLSEPYVFLLRPRRFGKSLFISTLNYYYDKNSENLFDSLFTGLYIHDHPTPKKNSYYILNFDFSGINTSSKDRLLAGFTEKVCLGLKKFETHYQVSLNYNKMGMPSEILGSFLLEVYTKIQGKIYVLIDEYDHFANELLSFQTEVFEETISKTGFVRKWYEVLKEGTKESIDRIFATGVSPVTLDSLTSGFNIATNITRDERFNESFGFTEIEVVNLFHTALGDGSIDWETTMPVLKKYYNGYLFSEKGENRIFNSDMVLYYLKNLVAFNCPPEDLIDANVSSDYSKIQALFKLKNEDQNFRILQEIIEEKTRWTAITREFSLAKSFSEDDFRSLLYYLGLLTIKETSLNNASLVMPNYVIKELYFDYFASVIREKAEFDLDVSVVRDAIREIALEGKIDLFCELIKMVLENLSNRDFIKFEEKYIKLLMLTYFMMSKIYYVKSEYEVKDGYIDIALLKRVNVDSKYQAIFEIKYIKQSDAQNLELQNEKMQEAKTQLAQYTQAEELRENPSLKKFAIVVAGTRCFYEEI